MYIWLQLFEFITTAEQEGFHRNTADGRITRVVLLTSPPVLETFYIIENNFVITVYLLLIEWNYLATYLLMS